MVLQCQNSLLDVWHHAFCSDAFIAWETSSNITYERNDHFYYLRILNAFDLCSGLQELEDRFQHRCEMVQAVGVAGSH